MKDSGKKPAKETLKIHIKYSFLAVMALVFCVFLLTSAHVFAAQAQTTGNVITAEQSRVMGWGFVAASIAVGIGSLGAGIAVGYVASAALGVISEKPELFGSALIFVGLAEGIAIYGLIISIMILMKI